MLFLWDRLQLQTEQPWHSTIWLLEICTERDVRVLPYWFMFHTPLRSTLAWLATRLKLQTGLPNGLLRMSCSAKIQKQKTLAKPWRMESRGLGVRLQVRPGMGAQLYELELMKSWFQLNSLWSSSWLHPLKLSLCRMLWLVDTQSVISRVMGSGDAAGEERDGAVSRVQLPQSGKQAAAASSSRPTQSAVVMGILYRRSPTPKQIDRPPAIMEQR